MQMQRQTVRPLKLTAEYAVAMLVDGRLHTACDHTQACDELPRRSTRHQAWCWYKSLTGNTSLHRLPQMWLLYLSPRLLSLDSQWTQNKTLWFDVFVLPLQPYFSSHTVCIVFCIYSVECRFLSFCVPHKSFTLPNGLFAKAVCYLGTREAQTPKCLMLCSLAICHSFTAGIACVITPQCIGRVP